MIVVDTQDNVVGSGPNIYRVDEPELGLIKVVMFSEDEFGYFFIGTADRDQYVIYTDTSVPDPKKIYKFYVLPDGTYEYVDVTPQPDPEP